MTSRPVIPLNDLSRAEPAVRAEVESAIRRVVRSGRYVTGPELEAFEEALADRLGTRYASGVANGTDALGLSLLALGCGPGDEVITVANACAFSTIAITSTGATPRLVEIDRQTHLLDTGALEAAIVPATKAVIVTHLYGRMAPVEEARRICDRAGVALVEDCAQAVGARRRGRRAGSFGDLAAISFYPGKNLGALGDGGAVVTSDAQLAGRVRKLREYGWGERYRVELAGGRNSRLDELQAAVLRTKLAHLARWTERRRAIARAYAEAIVPENGRLLASGAEDDVVHLAVVDAPRRDALRQALADRTIATAIHYPLPDHRQPALAPLFAGVALQATEDAARHVLTLPCFPELTAGEVDEVCEVLGKAL